MKRNLTIALAISSSLVLTACNITDIGAYESGVEVTQENIKQIENGGNKNAVVTAIGEPMRKEFKKGIEVWYYDYTKIRHLGGNVSVTKVFEFKDDTLVKHYETGNTSKTGNALLDTVK